MERSLGEGKGEETGDGSRVFLVEDWDLLCFFFFIMVWWLTYLGWMIFFSSEYKAFRWWWSFKQARRYYYYMNQIKHMNYNKKEEVQLYNGSTDLYLFIYFFYLWKIKIWELHWWETKVEVQFLILNDWCFTSQLWRSPNKQHFIIVFIFFCIYNRLDLSLQKENCLFINLQIIQRASL